VASVDPSGKRLFALLAARAHEQRVDDEVAVARVAVVKEWKNRDVLGVLRPPVPEERKQRERVGLLGVRPDRRAPDVERRGVELAIAEVVQKRGDELVARSLAAPREEEGRNAVVDALGLAGRARRVAAPRAVVEADQVEAALFVVRGEGEKRRNVEVAA